MKLTMIISYGARNFFSFKEGFEVSFEFPSKCPQNISNGRTVANTMCVKGANASGKTQILKALVFINYFATYSWNEKAEEEIPFLSFFDSKKSSDFYLNFLIGETKYRYELECTKKAVIREALYRIKERESLLWERQENEIIHCINEFSEFEKMTLKDNASVISTANQYGLTAIFEVYNELRKGNTNIAFSGRMQNYGLNLNDQSEFYTKFAKFAQFSSEFISKVDNSIESFKIQKHPLPDRGVSYFPMFKHRLANGNYKFLPYELQSNGIKALYRELRYYIITLNSGGILILDEFDTHLHPDILPLLINLFENPEINTKNAQFIFTAHNSEVLDSMSKYQTILVNKEDSESYAYRIDELPNHAVRVDRSLRSYYESGNLGGRPVLK